jgi:uncharacterized protein YecE (DUF72 family)
MKYHSGLSGLNLPVPKHMYPEEYQQTSRLAYYASIFNSIEINSSFYKLPRPNTIERWTNETPENFRFTFKVWKEITHNKLLEFREADVYSFMEVVAATGTKKGCLLLQLPPSCGIEWKNQLVKLISAIKKFDLAEQWKLAVEFRNTSWYDEDVFRLIEGFNACTVIHDMKKSATPQMESELKFKYVRFHGPTGNYRGTYPEDFLSEYATYINEWLNDGCEVFVYFNNTMGDAFNNLRQLDKMVHDVAE